MFGHDNHEFLLYHQQFPLSLSQTCRYILPRNSVFKNPEFFLIMCHSLASLSIIPLCLLVTTTNDFVFSTLTVTPSSLLLSIFPYHVSLIITIRIISSNQFQVTRCRGFTLIKIQPWYRRDDAARAQPLYHWAYHDGTKKALELDHTFKRL